MHWTVRCLILCYCVLLCILQCGSAYYSLGILLPYFFPICNYLQNYIKLDTVICKYLNLDVFVVVFCSFVIVKCYILVTVHLGIIPINNQYLPVCRSPTRSDLYQMLYWYKWLSWWWTEGCLKYVENRNK